MKTALSLILVSAALAACAPPPAPGTGPQAAARSPRQCFYASSVNNFQEVGDEAVNVRVGKGPNVYFELRDADGALPCAMWRDDFDQLGLAAGALADGSQVVVAGGPDYYPGSRTASPARAICSPSSTGCASCSTAKGCSGRRRRWRARRCRGRSGS